MAKKYDRIKSLSSQLYDIINDFTDKTGYLRPFKANDYNINLYEEINDFMSEVMKSGSIYDYRTYQDILVDDTNYTAGYVAVSWVAEGLKLYVFP